MGTRFNVVIPDELGREVDRLAEQAETSKGEVLRRAIQLYIAAKRGNQSNKIVGLADPDTRRLETEFVGL